MHIKIKNINLLKQNFKVKIDFNIFFFLHFEIKKKNNHKYTYKIIHPIKNIPQNNFQKSSQTKLPT